MNLLRRPRPLSLLPLGLAVALGVLWAVVELAPPSDGYTISVPVAPGRALYVVGWSRERIFIDTESNHSAITNVSDALTVSFWYQDNRAGTARRLLTQRLASWPLLAAAVCCGSVALALGRRPGFKLIL